MSVYIKRLSALAQRLEKIHATPPEKRKRIFDMSTWIDYTSCGTAACAMGEACYIPLLKQAGLRTTWNSEMSMRIPVLIRRGRKYYGEQAGRVLFGIDEHQSYELFMHGDLGTEPKDVADKIRAVIEEKKKKRAA